ncbi:hypothetical protein G6514_003662 [Epicoccum nigrum]|nr:hypothetical protein G6514_003662 [Epicoccum nigrum]
MTDAQRSALSEDDPEYAWRVIGSKIQVAGWTVAGCMLWTLKLCVTFFYLRLTHGLGIYRKRIYVAMVLIITSWLILMLTIFCSCRPFKNYWQIYPDPGNSCQPGISTSIIWSQFVMNVLTDLFLLFIPMPMLWKSSLHFYKKIATTVVLSAGVFIVICAVLKIIYVNTDPVHGGQLAAAWGTRETFVAVVTTNLPMIFPLFKVWFAPILPSSFRSSSNHKAYKSPSGGFVTIGGGGGSSQAKRTPRTRTSITANMTFDNESEERIMKDGMDVRMQDLHTGIDVQRPQGTIVVSKQVSVTTEERSFYHP